MLVFLDGATSKGTAPNENFGRELLELYTVGVGNFTEAVKAAAAALTGWVVRRRDGWKVRFVPACHDDTPQTLLGVDGVHDADTTIAAATSSPACPVFLAEAGRHLLGDIDDATVLALAATFSNADLDISALARATLGAGVGGLRHQPFCAAPVAAPRDQGHRCPRADRQLANTLRSMGQLLGSRRTSGAGPGAATWLASSATAARFSAAPTLPERHPTRLLRLRRPGRATGPGCRPVHASGWLLDATMTALEDLKPSVSARPGEGALALRLLRLTC